jgi:hypothetical protein
MGRVSTESCVARVGIHRTSDETHRVIQHSTEPWEHAVHCSLVAVKGRWGVVVFDLIDGIPGWDVRAFLPVFSQPERIVLRMTTSHWCSRGDSPRGFLRQG